MRSKIKRPLQLWEDSIIKISIKEANELSTYGNVNEFGEYYDEVTQSYRSVSRKYAGYF